MQVESDTNQAYVVENFTIYSNEELEADRRLFLSDQTVHPPALRSCGAGDGAIGLAVNVKQLINFAVI